MTDTIKILLKHTGLASIKDLCVDYSINRESRLVKIKLGAHFDSVLLINFLRNLDSDSDEDCSLVDNRADDTIKRPEGGLYAIELEFCGLLFDAKIVRMGSWLSQPGSPPQFTLSMQWKAI
jgi:hypothetical protein